MTLVELCLEQELRGTATLEGPADQMHVELTMPLDILSFGPNIAGGAPRA
jgi:hypothetical protein